MSERVTQHLLATLLANRHGLDEEEAARFVRQFFALLSEGLKADQYVRIKGLGTFKLMNAGEERQVVFQPETGLSEAVNKPFSHFETVLLKESTHYADLEEPVAETATAPGNAVLPPVFGSSEEKSSKEVPEDKSSEKKVSEKFSEDNVLEESLGQIPDDKCSAEVSSGQMQIEESPQETDSETRVPEYSPSAVMPARNTEEEKAEMAFVSRKILQLPWCMMATILLVGVLVGGGLVWALMSGRRYIPASVEQTFFQTVAVRDSAVETDSVNEAAVPVDVQKKQSDTIKTFPQLTLPLVEKQPSKEAMTPMKILSDTVAYQMKGVMTTHTVRTGESLVRLAKKYYGNKNLWPYLVKFNKDMLPDADHVSVGVTLRIPELVPVAE